MAPQQLVNGETVQSKSLDHLKSYPVIKDTLNSSIGQRILGLLGQGYHTFFVPLKPYLDTPYSFIHPYVQAADSYADAGLSKFEQQVPQVKEPTTTLRESVLNLAFFPVQKAAEGKTYVFNTYSEQYKKCGGDKAGLVGPVKATVSTGLTVGSDLLAHAADYLGAKKEEVKSAAKSAKETAKEKTGNK